MAKHKNFDAQLESIDNEIERTKKKLNQLGVERDEVLKQKQQAELSALYKAICEAGLSVSDVASMIKPSKKEDVA